MRRAVKRTLRWLPALWALLSIACAAYYGRGGGDTIKVPHAIHQKAKVDCLACHESIYDATALGGDFLPKEKKCLECHEEKKQQGQCGFCHTDARNPGTYRRREPHLKMGHALHIEKVKEDCARCHQTLPEPGRPAAPPTMEACLGCHEHQREFDQGRCEGCHRDLSRFPLRPVSSFSHQGDYLAQHGRSARAAASACATCHEQSFCSDCHASTVSTRIEVKMPERQDRQFIHRDDFLGRHSIEARADATSCRRCHGASFCDNCHTLQNLTRRGQDPRNPHPPGFSIPGTAQFHGAAARRDINSCASCHDQGPSSNCVDCHRVGGTGGNPHPPAWMERHDRQEIQRNGMCRYCHTL